LRGVEEVRFETIQWFDCERDMVSRERLTDGLIRFDGALPLLLGATTAREVADRAIQRPGDDPSAAIGRRLDRVLQMLLSFTPYRGIVANQAQTMDQDGADRALEPARFGILPNLGGGKLRRTKQRDFHSVKPA